MHIRTHVYTYTNVCIYMCTLAAQWSENHNSTRFRKGIDKSAQRLALCGSKDMRIKNPFYMFYRPASYRPAESLKCTST